MRITRLKILIITIVLLGLVLIFGISRGKKPVNQANSFKPPAAAVNTVTRYLQLRENSVGVDQPTPNAWLSPVKPFVTPTWFDKLQPSTNSPTGNVPRDYYTAHANNWIVKAIVTNCIWDTKAVQPTSSSGVITCSLSDQTIDRASGNLIPASSIPFGWGHNGEQFSSDFKVVNQNNNWLISSVSASTAE